jgi:hypothetical protein
MAILDKLTFAEESHKPVGKVVDPLAKAKDNLIGALQEQKGFAKLLMEGKEPPKRSRLMFWQFSGSYRLLPKIGFDAVKIHPNQPEIVCAELEEVMQVCDTLIEATKAGELNEAIRRTISTRPLRGRAAAKAKMSGAELAEPPMTELADETAAAEPAKGKPRGKAKVAEGA